MDCAIRSLSSTLISYREVNAGLVLPTFVNVSITETSIVYSESVRYPVRVGFERGLGVIVVVGMKLAVGDERHPHRNFIGQIDYRDRLPRLPRQNSSIVSGVLDGQSLDRPVAAAVGRQRRYRPGEPYGEGHRLAF